MHATTKEAINCNPIIINNHFIDSNILLKDLNKPFQDVTILRSTRGLDRVCLRTLNFWRAFSNIFSVSSTERLKFSAVFFRSPLMIKTFWCAISAWGSYKRKSLRKSTTKNHAAPPKHTLTFIYIYFCNRLWCSVMQYGIYIALLYFYSEVLLFSELLVKKMTLFSLHN